MMTKRKIRKLEGEYQFNTGEYNFLQVSIKKTNSILSKLKDFIPILDDMKIDETAALYLKESKDKKEFLLQKIEELKNGSNCYKERIKDIKYRYNIINSKYKVGLKDTYYKSEFEESYILSSEELISKISFMLNHLPEKILMLEKIKTNCPFRIGHYCGYSLCYRGERLCKPKISCKDEGDIIIKDDRFTLASTNDSFIIDNEYILPSFSMGRFIRIPYTKNIKAKIYAGIYFLFRDEELVYIIKYNEALYRKEIIEEIENELNKKIVDQYHYELLLNWKRN